VEGQDRKLTIVLHYPDGSAAADIDELNRRFPESMVTMGGLDTPRLLSDIFTIGERGDGLWADSILKFELAYKTDTRMEVWAIW
jgi:hypothetical protein